VSASILCLSQCILSKLTTNHCDTYIVQLTLLYISHLTQIGRLHDALALHACVRWTVSPPLLIRCPPSLLSAESASAGRDRAVSQEARDSLCVPLSRGEHAGSVGEKTESRGSSIQHSAFRSEDSVYNIPRTTHTHTPLSGPPPVRVYYNYVEFGPNPVF